MWNDSPFILSGDSYTTLLETASDNFLLYITIIIAIVTTATMSNVVVTDNTERAAVRNVILNFSLWHDSIVDTSDFGNVFTVVEFT